MLYRTVAPVRRKGTANFYYQERIPKGVRDRTANLTVLVPIGPERIRYTISEKAESIRISLRTPIPAEIKIRNAEVAAFFDTLWRSLRASQPIALTHRQCVALVREVFAVWADAERGRFTAIEFERTEIGAASYELLDTNFLPEELHGMAERYGEELREPDAAKLETVFGRSIDHNLRDRGIAAVDTASRVMILKEFQAALRDGYAVQARQAAGDYSPAPEAARFPEWNAPKSVAVVDNAKAAGRPNNIAKVSLKGLVDLWWAEAEPAGRSRSTHESYKASVYRLAAFLKHDDVHRVTSADVLAFKNDRLANGVSLKTIKDSDLSGLKSIFNFAVSNRLMDGNPAEGIKVLRPKRAITREQGFTAEEAVAILTKSIRHERAPNENPKTALAKRWVPWLCAYTGARVGEVVQLRKEDVAYHPTLKLWTITITPEAGTVKDKEVRRVVLHEHLIEQGFPDFVKGSRAGPLFLEVKPGEDIRGKWRATKNRLAEFAREVVPDPRVKPSHGWRHGFTSIAREVGIEDSVLYAIGGWSAPTVGGRYGDVSLAAQARAMGKFPRFKVEDE